MALLGKDRLDEFVGYYLPDPNRNILIESNYVIQDFINGIWQNPSADRLDTLFDHASLIKSRFLSQISILSSLYSRIDSVLSDVLGHLFAELQDNELKVASQLIKINLRAAGALAGVMLEGHLQRVAVNHGFFIQKTNQTIADLNDSLRGNNVYDIITWRKIQHLADIRNYCDHKKDREPTEGEVNELITGTDSIIKTIF